MARFSEGPSFHCRHCQRDVRPLPRHRGLARVGLALVALGMVLAVLAASLIGPFIMFAVPFMALFGTALGPLVALATEAPHCERCHRELVYRSRTEASAYTGRQRAVTSRAGVVTSA